jgi:glycosyltransferase involved in cell wall biosynthesis
VLVVPTCVDYDRFPAKEFQDSDPLVFGWIGGNHNLYQLQSIIPSLNTLSKDYKFNLRVIAGVSEFPFQATFPVHFIPFNLETEVEELKKIDVGLMPLEDSVTTRGKCGFKLIQYMGLGIPGIASAITVNKEIINDRENGWLVHSISDWEQTFKEIFENRSIIPTLGKHARDTITKKYSFQAHFKAYQDFLLQFPNKCR